MVKHAHGDPRRPDGDLVSPMKPEDRRDREDLGEFGPKAGWGHDAVYRPAQPGSGEGDLPSEGVILDPDDASPGTASIG